VRGLGVALAWPLSDARWFAPWRPVAVSPIGADFFSLRGLRVLASEARWILMPTLLASILIAGVGMLRSRRQAVDAP
jgi:inner membrane protein